MFIVTEKAERPAGKKGECFYCSQPIGAEHKPGCVLIKRRAKIRMIFEYEIDIPASWGKDEVEFQRNEGSWCADNALRELDDLVTENECLCDITSCEFVEITSEPELDE